MEKWEYFLIGQVSCEVESEKMRCWYVGVIYNYKVLWFGPIEFWFENTAKCICTQMIWLYRTAFNVSTFNTQCTNCLEYETRLFKLSRVSVYTSEHRLPDTRLPLMASVWQTFCLIVDVETSNIFFFVGRGWVCTACPNWDWGQPMYLFMHLDNCQL